MENVKILAIVGMSGSGKSVAVDHLTSKGYPKVYFGGMVYKEMEKRGIERTEDGESEKKFREDLYFRIQVMPIEMPPLRERGQDVLLLAEEFLKRYAAEYGRGKFKFSRNAEKALLSYHWPGNVRELENKIQKSLVQAVHGVVQPKDLGLEDVQKESKESPRTLKEARESLYWLELLHRNNYLTDDQYNSINADCEELVKILVHRLKKINEITTEEQEK